MLLFAVLLAYGVTALRGQTAVEFAGIEHGQALRDYRDHRATAHARTSAPPPPPATHAGTGANGGRVESLERLAALRDSGALTNEEYQAEKATVLHGST